MNVKVSSATFANQIILVCELPSACSHPALVTTLVVYSLLGYVLAPKESVCRPVLITDLSATIQEMKIPSQNKDCKHVILQHNTAVCLSLPQKCTYAVVTSKNSYCLLFYSGSICVQSRRH